MCIFFRIVWKALMHVNPQRMVDASNLNLTNWVFQWFALINGNKQFEMSKAICIG